MNITKEMQMKMAENLYLKGFLTENQMNGFSKRGNKGIIAEMKAVEQLGIKTVFDNKPGTDFTYKGINIQFKYLGCNSNPSVTETKKAPTETPQQFINRIMEKYKEVNEFWIYIENDLEINLNQIIKLTPEQFKEFLSIQTIKDNNKIRLAFKNHLRKYQ